MKDERLVSVVIPAFNAERTLRRTVASVLAQTHEHLEIIICDDASTDDTYTVAREINDKRVRVQHNKSNRGAGATRDKVLATAHGDWVAFIDADDAWHARRLEELFKSTNADYDVMVFDDLLLHHHTKTGIHQWRRLRGATAFGTRDGQPIDVVAAAWVSARHFLIKPLIPMAALKETGIRHSDRRFGEDTEFFLRLIAAGFKLRFLPKAYYQYYITPGSASATRNRAKIMRDMLEEVLPLFEGDADMQRALKRKITYRDFTMAIKSGDIRNVARLTSRDPSLISELVRRSFGEVPYQLHRLLHGGMGR